MVKDASSQQGQILKNLHLLHKRSKSTELAQLGQVMFERVENSQNQLLRQFMVRHLGGGLEFAMACHIAL